MVRDFLKDNILHVGWSKGGKFQVHAGKEMLVEAITTEQNPVVTMKRNITISPRTLVMVEMQANIPDMEGSTYYDFHTTSRYEGQAINLILIPIAYHTNMAGQQILLQLLINLEEQPIKVEKGTTMGHLLDIKDTAGLIETPTVNDSVCDTCHSVTFMHSPQLGNQSTGLVTGVYVKCPPVMVLRTAIRRVGKNLPYAYSWI